MYLSFNRRFVRNLILTRNDDIAGQSVVYSRKPTREGVWRPDESVIM